jgi:hypothetical protein
VKGMVVSTIPQGRVGEPEEIAAATRRTPLSSVSPPMVW